MLFNWSWFSDVPYASVFELVITVDSPLSGYISEVGWPVSFFEYKSLSMTVCLSDMTVAQWEHIVSPVIPSKIKDFDLHNWQLLVDEASDEGSSPATLSTSLYCWVGFSVK